MPKSICTVCGIGEIIEVPMDPEGTYTYPLCSNKDCPTYDDPYAIDDPFVDMDEPPPATDLKDSIKVLREGLESLKRYILGLIQDGDALNARSLLEGVINMLLPDDRIPPGRAWATESQKDHLGMRETASKNFHYAGMDKGKLRFLTREVFEWLLQTEEDLRQELIERAEYLLRALRDLIAGQKDPPSPRAVEMLKKIEIILMAIHKIDRQGSPPLVPEG
jgi:hypothetical protein